MIKTPLEQLAEIALLAKSHVSSYTTKAGTYVAAHSDKRASKPLKAHADALASVAENRRRKMPQDDYFTPKYESMSFHLKRNNRPGVITEVKGLQNNGGHEHLDAIMQHVHPDHWQGLGYNPSKKSELAESYHRKFSQ
jgi:hypothetical protein